MNGGAPLPSSDDCGPSSGRDSRCFVGYRVGLLCARPLFEEVAALAARAMPGLIAGHVGTEIPADLGGSGAPVWKLTTRDYDVVCVIRAGPDTGATIRFGATIRAPGVLRLRVHAPDTVQSSAEQVIEALYIEFDRRRRSVHACLDHVFG